MPSISILFAKSTAERNRCNSKASMLVFFLACCSVLCDVMGLVLNLKPPRSLSQLGLVIKHLAINVIKGLWFQNTRCNSPSDNILLSFCWALPWLPHGLYTLPSSWLLRMLTEQASSGGLKAPMFRASKLTFLLKAPRATTWNRQWQGYLKIPEVSHHVSFTVATVDPRKLRPFWMHMLKVDEVSTGDPTGRSSESARLIYLVLSSRSQDSLAGNSKTCRSAIHNVGSALTGFRICSLCRHNSSKAVANLVCAVRYDGYNLPS